MHRVYKVSNRRRLACISGLVVLLTVAAAQGAVIKVGDLVLRADGGFSPNALPKNRFAPIDFHGHADLERRGGGVPAALQQAVLEFDHDGRLSTAGLATCPAERVANATPKEARTVCANAIVGEGHIEGMVSLPGGGAIGTSSPLTLFNGPRVGPNATVTLHAQLTTLAPQTFAVVVPIEKRSGTFGYRATVDVPTIAGGLGALTHVDVKIGRRFVSKGVKRSYVSARCHDGAFETHGAFTFADGTKIEGAVAEFCKMQ